jgi:hypothetical protein
MDPARELAQLVNRESQLGRRRRDQRLRSRRIGADPRLEQAKLHAERDKSLLCAVVQVTLESPPFGVGLRDDPRTSGAQGVELAAPQCAQPLVIEREAGHDPDFAHDRRVRE